ncbi:hypothetical protein FPANT_14214 [Fusarium pseudoanthophilum]|uniref:Uncharacterized protein n=1 Tax=Fusarium pseudoanthophilum TaxID=48495 RepID=A0A8H5JZG6_9HYPO|nr:hypothetical protein FPANT_14214 [Fusarium pseudoanthophilum]
MAAVAQSDAVSYETFEKLVASQNGGPLPSDLESFYKYILAQPDGPSDLSALAATTATKADITSNTADAAAPEVKAAGFRNSTSANGSVINLWVYQRVYVNTLGKTCTINIGGVTPGFPGGATFSTLYYDKESDLSGDCNVVFTGFTSYFALYFRKNNNLFATYQSGNVGWATGVAGGSGNWA